MSIGHEFSRSAVIGTLASLVAAGLFNWLVHWEPGGFGAWLNGWPVTAFLLANSISMLLTYQLSRVWAFRHREPTGFLGGAPLFFAISTASLVIPVACLWISRNVLMLDSAAADNVAANLVGLFLGFLTRFALFRLLVFRPADTVSEEEPTGRSSDDRAPRPSRAAPGD
ncbi:GtrA family protein [uncultured Nocardioides sp.]|uniref:GtrA family protein n=1 Tax=uncultured Nocardioides sp. TaxID=198441 RepID=UPI00260E3CFB|nr:GtrA family protein [uncultured Nocardioides sp.]